MKSHRSPHRVRMGRYASIRTIYPPSGLPRARRLRPSKVRYETTIRANGEIKLPVQLPGWTLGRRLYWKLMPDLKVQISTSPKGALRKGRFESARVRRALPERRWKFAV